MSPGKHEYPKQNVVEGPSGPNGIEKPPDPPDVDPLVLVSDAGPRFHVPKVMPSTQSMGGGVKPSPIELASHGDIPEAVAWHEGGT